MDVFYDLLHVTWQPYRESMGYVVFVSDPNEPVYDVQYKCIFCLYIILLWQ